MIYMLKTVNHKTRYYQIELIKNLFEEYIVLNTYGAIANKSPTGIIRHFFPTIKEAKLFLNNELIRKQKTGYKNIEDIS